MDQKEEALTMELNELSRQVQVKLHQYCYKFKEDYSKSDSRFIHQMHFGILKSGSVQLSSIGRTLSEDISHKYTRLDSLSKEILFQPLLSLVKKTKLSELFGFIYYKLALGLRMILAGCRMYRELLDPPDTDQLALDLEGA